MTFNLPSSIQNALRAAGLNRRDVRVKHNRSERVLRFGATDVQSSMDLQKPDHLVLNYTRLMMGFMLFQPYPDRILMIGLGGGSLPKFCHRHFPGTDITVIEIDPRVIALRDQFEVPPDQANFRVVQGDGADVVAAMNNASTDVILVDGFHADSMAAALGTLSFYRNCARLLTRGGVMVCNLHEFDPRFAAYLQRIAQCFESDALDVEADESFNSVVFARRGKAINSRIPKHAERPKAMLEQAWNSIQSDVGRVLAKAARLPPQPKLEGL